MLHVLQKRKKIILLIAAAIALITIASSFVSNANARRPQRSDKNYVWEPERIEKMLFLSPATGANDTVNNEMRTCA